MNRVKTFRFKERIKMVSLALFGKASNQIRVGIELVRCSECDKHNTAIQVYDMLDWRSMPFTKIIGYDRERGVITISEKKLMRAITMVNPMQKVCPLELVHDADSEVNQP